MYKYIQIHTNIYKYMQIYKYTKLHRCVAISFAGVGIRSQISAEREMATHRRQIPSLQPMCRHFAPCAMLFALFQKMKSPCFFFCACTYVHIYGDTFACEFSLLGARRTPALRAQFGGPPAGPGVLSEMKLRSNKK